MYPRELVINGEKYVTLTIIKNQFNLLSLAIEEIRKAHGVRTEDRQFKKEGEDMAPNIRYFHLEDFERGFRESQKRLRAQEANVEKSL